MNENIKVLGRKPYNELVYWFGACNFFISSSLNEGKPTMMFESLSCGMLLKEKVRLSKSVDYY